MRTETDCEPLPPGPVQFRVNVLSAASAELVSVPEVALVPVHAPDAAQDVALVADQVNDVVAPLATETGVAVNVTTGAGGAGATNKPYVPALATAFGLAMKFRKYRPGTASNEKVPPPKIKPTLVVSRVTASARSAKFAGKPRSLSTT